MSKQWIAMALVLALALGACLSMPVMAEKLIDENVDRVIVEREALDTFRKPSTSAEAPKPVSLSGAAAERLEADARKAYQDAFGEAIPDGYAPMDLRAYESDDGDGNLGCTLIMMPEGWEQDIDALSIGERKPYYTIQFGNLNAETGEAELLGAQKFYLMLNDDAVSEFEIDETARSAMESAARKFAQDKGYEVGALISSGKVTGSFETGLSMEFSITGGRTLTLTVALDGTVNGYSLVPGKG